MIYFTSDNHFFHAKVMEYSNRPWDNVEDMNQGMKEQWNRTVTPQDSVWMLGDVGFAKTSTLATFLKGLNGKKNLVYGNHDKQLRKASKQLIEEGVFETMQDYKILKTNKQKYYLFHFAGRTWENAQYDSIHLFGHTHGYLPPRGRSVDVGVDDKNITDEYRPYSIEEVNEFMRNRTRHTNHHEDADFPEQIIHPELGGHLDFGDKRYVRIS